MRMGRESEPGRFRGQEISQLRCQGGRKGYFNKSLSSSLYKLEEVKFATSPSKQVYTYTVVKDIIIQRVQR